MAGPAEAPAPLSPAVVERGLRFGIVDGIFAQAMFTLCSGAILAALALFAGMSDLEYGILAALPFLSQLIQLPAGFLYRRYQNRKRITLAFATAGRLCILIVALAVLTFPPELRTLGIFAGLFGWCMFTAVASGSWLWWMRDLVPEERLGRYFGLRGALLIGLSGPVLFGAGLFIDHQRALSGVDGERMAFGAVYVVAALFGIGSSIFLTLMPHPPVRDDPSAVPMRQALAAPFKDRGFRRMLQWLALWGFGATVTVPFFPVFLLVDHGLPLSTVTAILVTGTATNVLFYILWGRLSDRFGNKPVLGVCVPVFTAGLLATVLLPDGGPLEIVGAVVVQVLLSIGVAGADLASWNLAFKMAKGPTTSAYLSGTLLVRAMATGTGPIIGGLIGGIALTTSVDLGLVRLSHLDFVFLVGAVLIALSGRPLSLVKETGEAPRRELLLALGAVVRGEDFPRGLLSRGRRGEK